MPATSEAQQRAMYAAAEGKSRLGIPEKVGKEFIGDADAGHAAGTMFVGPEGDILFVKRSDEETNFAGHWALPGGGAEDDESPKETAAREAQEEIGDVPTSGPAKLIDRRKTPNGLVFHTFAQPVERRFMPTLNSEHTAFAWRQPHDLPEPLHPAVRDTIEKQIKANVSAHDMSPDDWEGLRHGFLKWLSEEEAEPEHAKDGMASDCLAFDRGPEENRTKTEDGRLLVKVSNFSKANVCPYLGDEIPNWQELGLDPKKIYHLYRDPAELKKAAHTFDKVPLLLVHKASTAADHPKEVTIGTTGENTLFEAPYLQGSLAIWDGAGIEAVESKRQTELSCGYRYDADMRPGRTPDGVPFDGRMVNIRGNHVAIVENGRAGDDVVVGDSAERVNSMKIKLSRAGAAAYGALIASLRPKMATDAKLNMGKAFVGVTAANFKERAPGIKLALDGALKGKILSPADPKKLASDAEANEVIKAAAKLVDMFDPAAEEGMDDDPDMTGMDEAWDEEDDKALAALQAKKKAAEDRQARDSETDEEKKKREEAEAKKAAEDEAANGGKESPVTKAAMDSAIAVAVRETEAKTVARMQGIADAKVLVEPLVGKIAVAMDSADAVYIAALKSLGIAADGINTAGMKALIQRELAHKSAQGRSTPRLATDAAGKTERQSAEAALGITTKRVRHV